MTATDAFDAQEIDTERLVEQIVRYLAAVDEFRRQGCELRWRPEPSPR